MIKKALLVLALLIVGVLLYAATRPDTFQVERTAVVQAPPQAVYAQIANFRRWSAWSPWENRDPAMEKRYSGPATGVGSAYAWSGNSEVGSGRMEILEATPDSQIRIQLDFIEPIASSNITRFTLVPQGDATRVTWSMSGENSYPGKLMSVFMDMDEMIGRDFEQGLAQLEVAARN